MKNIVTILLVIFVLLQVLNLDFDNLSIYQIVIIKKYGIL